MPTSLYPFLAFMVLMALIAVAVAVISHRSRRQDRQRQDALRAAAAERGWSCETLSEGRFDLTRWQGQTDGVRWSAEYHRQRHKQKNRSRIHRLRWWAEGFQGPGDPVLLIGVPKGKENPAVKLAQGESLLASLAQKAAGFALDKSLDLHFGESVGQQVDARTLRTVEAAALPGFIVMATDANQGLFWLDQQGQRALIEAQMRDPASALSDERDRLWVLWLGHAVHLARQAPVTTLADLERLVRAGVALVRTAQ